MCLGCSRIDFDDSNARAYVHINFKIFFVFLDLFNIFLILIALQVDPEVTRLEVYHGPHMCFYQARASEIQYSSSNPAPSDSA